MIKSIFTHLNEGDIIGISYMGSIRNAAIIGKNSNGILRCRAILGQFDIAFAYNDPLSTIDNNHLRKLSNSPELLNGAWAKGMSVAFAGELPEKMFNELAQLNNSLKNKSALGSKEILAKADNFIKSTFSFMNNVANDPEPELPLRMAM